jgi:hypothetical protein
MGWAFFIILFASIAGMSAILIAYLGTIGTAVLALCGIAKLVERKQSIPQPVFARVADSPFDQTKCGKTGLVRCKNPTCNAGNPSNARFCRRCRQANPASEDFMPTKRALHRIS